MKELDQIICSLNETDDGLHFMLKCTFYTVLCSKLLSNTSATYDTDNMFDTCSEFFVLLMGFQEYDSISSVIKLVKSTFEIRVTVHI